MSAHHPITPPEADAPRTVVVQTSWATIVAVYSAEDIPLSVTRYPAGVELAAVLERATLQAEVIDTRWQPWETPNLADYECPHGRLESDREPCPSCHSAAKPKEVLYVNAETMVERCKAAFLEILADGPVPAQEVNERLVAAGIKLSNRGAIAEARKQLGVVSRKSKGHHGAWIVSMLHPEPDPDPATTMPEPELLDDLSRIVDEAIGKPGREVAAQARELADDLLAQAREVAANTVSPPVEPLAPAAQVAGPSGDTAFTVLPDAGLCVVCRAEASKVAGVPLCDEHADRWDEFWSRDAVTA